MEDAIEQLQTKDTKERMAGVERLQDILEQSRKGLSTNEVGSLVDASLVLLKDNNFRVSQGTLQALASAAALAGEHLKLHLNSLLPAVVERLGDGKQPVRDAGRQLLLALMEISSPTIVVERARSFAWGHRKWRVREEFARTVASAVNLFAATELPFLRMLLPSVLSLLEDSNSSVREAAMLCLEEMYRQGGSQFRDELQFHQLRPAQFKDITCRLDNIEPVRCSFEGLANRIITSSQVRDLGQCLISERKLSLVATTARRSSLRVKPALTEVPIGDARTLLTTSRMSYARTLLTTLMNRGLMQMPSELSSCNVQWSMPKIRSSVEINVGISGGRETGEHHVNGIRVHSEKELVKEIEKAAVLLTPDQDWSVRIAAMQRIEGLVAGGAAEYASFNSLMKQLVGPLNGQLSDRRSSIVKQATTVGQIYFLFEHFLRKFVVQACQLLNLLSKELLVNFETFAESFIPVLFKLVVITVLVIAESADICIKTMLRYCRVSRVLPKLVECAKHDRNAVLRARCCEYALLVLEQWGDSPEIQRSVDLYEELIKCCVGDAVSEVRCSARICYRLFSKCWPERVQRIFVTFDASVQRLLNEEGVVYQKRYVYPSMQEWGYEQQQLLKQPSNMPVTATRHQSATHATPAHLNATTVNAERSTSILSPAGIPVMNRAHQGTSAELVTARSLERVLQASQQQVHAIENMLKGGEKIDKIGTRAPGSRDVMAGISDKGALSMSPKMALRDPGGSYEGICGASVTKHVGMDHSSACDRPYPTLVLASSQIASHGARRPAGTPATDILQGHGSVSSGGISGVDNFKAQQLETFALGRDSHLPIVDADRTGNEFVGSLFTGATARRVPQDKPITNCGSIHYPEIKGPKRVMRIDFADKSAVEKKQVDSACIPGFQRPLLRQRSSGSARSSVDENSVLAQFNARGEMHKYTGVLMPLTDALIEGLSVNADWSARVAAFTFLRKVLQQGPRGLQEINQSFGMAMKLFSAHLDDPHHKVAHAALSTLAELVPVCRKSFEAYLERILPHVFGRLVDAKEVIRQLGSTVLEIVGNTYSVDSVLPALLRSLDEQRSPKVKMAVIEFATVASAKLALNRETSGGTGLVKLWLAKLGPLAHDKNPKLKEAAVKGIISVYSQFDSTTVLNFILGLSIEEQSLLRRSLKQYTPRVEVDLMSYVQNKSQRGRSKLVHEHPEPASATPEIFAESWKRGHSRLSGNEFLLGDSSSSINRDGSRKWESTQHSSIYTGHRLLQQTAASELTLETFQSCETSQITKEISGHLHSDSFQSGRMEETMNVVKGIDTRSNSSGVQDAEIYQCPIDSRIECRKCPSIDSTEQFNSQEMVSAEAAPEAGRIDGLQLETQVKYDDKFVWKVNNTVLSEDSDYTVTNLLQQLTSSDSVKPAKKKYDTLLQLMMLRVNDSAAWSEHFNQILMVILESMENSDIAVKELALSATFEMLNNQKSGLGEFTENMLQKLLQCTMDSDLKVSTLADRCRTIVLTEFDPLQCLPVLVQLLVSDDQKTLVTCISSLTRLVSRLLPENLVAQLPSFLPALFKAFGNQDADVRKTVVFCLVDIYIVLGEAFVPYLRSLSSTQLRLVTIYATRISKARTGTSTESGNL